MKNLILIKESNLPKGMSNVLQYAAREETFFEVNAFYNCDYKRKTTFFSDLSIAECFGEDEIKNTYERVVKEWHNNVEFFTEFVIALNHKCWEWYEREGKESRLSKLYCDLYHKADNMALNTFSDDDLNYYYSTTD